MAAFKGLNDGMPFTPIEVDVSNYENWVTFSHLDQEIYDSIGEDELAQYIKNSEKEAACIFLNDIEYAAHLEDVYSGDYTILHGCEYKCGEYPIKMYLGPVDNPDNFIGYGLSRCPSAGFEYETTKINEFLPGFREFGSDSVPPKAYLRADSFSSEGVPGTCDESLVDEKTSELNDASSEFSLATSRLSNAEAAVESAKLLVQNLEGGSNEGEAEAILSAAEAELSAAQSDYNEKEREYNNLGKELERLQKQSDDAYSEIDEELAKLDTEQSALNSTRSLSSSVETRLKDQIQNDLDVISEANNVFDSIETARGTLQSVEDTKKATSELNDSLLAGAENIRLESDQMTERAESIRELADASRAAVGTPNELKYARQAQVEALAMIQSSINYSKAIESFGADLVNMQSSMINMHQAVSQLGDNLTTITQKMAGLAGTANDSNLAAASSIASELSGLQSNFTETGHGAQYNNLISTAIDQEEIADRFNNEINDNLVRSNDTSALISDESDNAAADAQALSASIGQDLNASNEINTASSIATATIDEIRQTVDSKRAPESFAEAEIEADIAERLAEEIEEMATKAKEGIDVQSALLGEVNQVLTEETAKSTFDLLDDVSDMAQDRKDISSRMLESFDDPLDGLAFDIQGQESSLAESTDLFVEFSKKKRESLSTGGEGCCSEFYWSGTTTFQIIPSCLHGSGINTERTESDPFPLYDQEGNFIGYKDAWHPILNSSYRFNYQSSTQTYYSDVGSCNYKRSVELSDEMTEERLIDLCTPTTPLGQLLSEWQARFSTLEVRRYWCKYKVKCRNLTKGFTYKVSLRMNRFVSLDIAIGGYEAVELEPYTFTATSDVETIDDGGDFFDMPHVQGYGYFMFPPDIEIVSTNV